MAEDTRIVPARIISLEFIRSYVITMRPYLLFVSGATGIAGLSLAPPIGRFNSLLLSLIFFLAYGFGQALTDCFQMDTDALSSPYRPLVQGRIRRRDVAVVSLVGLAFSGVVFVAYNVVNLPLVVAAVVGLATYTYFKRRWWAGPLYNAWIVAVLCLVGYVSGVGGARVPVTWSPALIAALVTAFCAYANFVLTGYYKDITADRATGYNTLPVVFGLRVSSVVSDAFALAAVCACGVAVWCSLQGAQLGAQHGLPILLATGGIAATVLGQVRLHSVTNEADAHRAIVPVVHAYILLMSAIAAVQKPAWAAPLAGFYIGFVAVMRLRPMRQQV
jgi:4-hydroxybenzoate polyprenyltransferase